MSELSNWIHVDAIQALVHHASAVIAAIFIFGVTARLIAYLIPNGHAKRIVLIIDDVVLLAVFALAGCRLVGYMWVRPHMEEPTRPMVPISRPAQTNADGTEELLERCRKQSANADEVGRCLEENQAQAKQALTGAVARMRADMRALDKVGSAKIGAATSFDAAQAAFMMYREAECRWRSTSARNGASADFYRACIANLARRRAAQIEEMMGK